MVSRSQNGGLVRFGSMRWPAQTCPRVGPQGATCSGCSRAFSSVRIGFISLACIGLTPLALHGASIPNQPGRDSALSLAPGKLASRASGSWSLREYAAPF